MSIRLNVINKIQKMNTLYIHIPFCEQKCFYCSFVVSIGQASRIDHYLDCLEKEAQRYHGEAIQSIYIGGGTPTVITELQLQRLFQIVHKHFTFSSDIEWTIEANPEGLNDSKLNLLKQEGINRISLGIQSLNDKYLKYLGRNHDASTATQAFDQMRKAGFDNINVDLMFSFPKQTMTELKEDVAALTQLGSEHLSLYALTIEENSKFFVQNIKLQDDHDQARHYQFVCDALKAKGFQQYEVSNFSKPTRESRHNLNYWQGGHYIGLGIGAHSHRGAKRSWNISELSEYILRLQKGRSVEKGSEKLTSYDMMKEVVLFGLRMNRGVSIKQVTERFGCFLDDEQQKKIDQFIEGGFFIKEEDTIKTSAKGRLVLDELCAQLV